MQALFIIKKLIAFSVIEFQYAFKTIDFSITLSHVMLLASRAKKKK
jgi:hypothetical protein